MTIKRLLVKIEFTVHETAIIPYEIESDNIFLHRRRLEALITFHQYVDELYEKYLPKQFPRSVSLPAFYTAPPDISEVLSTNTELVESPLTSKITPPSILSLEQLKSIAVRAKLVDENSGTKIRGTTASAIWGMIELLDAANLIQSGSKCKMALYLASQYNVKMRPDYDGPNGFSLVRTNAWHSTGLALVELSHFSEKQRKEAMTELNSKKNSKSSKKVG